MNTPAHIIFSLALLGPHRAAKFAVVITMGALLPDVMMMVFYAFEKWMQVPEQIIWNQHYAQPFWQNIFDLTNSIPIFVAAAIICAYLKRYSWMFLWISSIIHCLLDFWVHREDSHRHFFPFSDYRFISPVSYWDPAHYGGVISVLEIVFFAIGCVFLWTANRTVPLQLTTMSTLRVIVLITGVIYAGFFYFVVSTWSNM